MIVGGLNKLLIVGAVLCLILAYQDFKDKSVNDILAKVTYLYLVIYASCNYSYIYMFLLFGVFLIKDNLVDDIFLIVLMLYLLETKMVYLTIIPIIFYIIYRITKTEKIPLLGIYSFTIYIILISQSMLELVK